MDVVIRWTGKLLKNLKTPFFSWYSKFLPMANWYRSRTSPKFFSKKNSNKCSRKSRPKFWRKWAVAGRLVEQGQKFFCQFSADTWWTSPENFSSIAWFIFESLLINWFFADSLVPSLVTFDQKCTKVTILGTKHSEKNQLISNKTNINQAIFLKISAFVHQVFALNWRKNFCRHSISLPATAHFGQNFGRL